MAEQSKFRAFAKKAPGIVGEGLDIIGSVVDVLKRKPNVRAWAKAKRQEKRRLRAKGLSGSNLRQQLQVWQQSNPKPRGSDPYNPTALGQSNQMDASNNSQIGGFAPVTGDVKGTGTPTMGFPSDVPTKKGGFKFNPLLLLFALPFVFPKQFKGIRRRLKI